MRNSKSNMLITTALLSLIAGCSTIDSTPIVETRALEGSQAAHISLKPSKKPDGKGLDPTIENADQAEPAGGAYDGDPSAATGRNAEYSPPPSQTQASNPVTASVSQSPSAAVTARQLEGIAYFLPRQLSKVSVKRVKKTVKDGIEKLTKLELGLVAAQANVTQTEANLKVAEDRFLEPSSDAEARKILSSRLAEARKAVEEAKKKFDTAKADRDKAKEALEQSVASSKLPENSPASNDVGKNKTNPGQNVSTSSEPAKDIYEVSVSISQLTPTADPQFGFRLNPRHSVFRDDAQELTISPAGLLTNTNIQSTDRTGDILIEMAAFSAAQAVGGGGRSSAGDTKPSGEPCKDPTPSQLEAVLDLNNPEHLSELNLQLSCMGAKIERLDAFNGTGPAAVQSRKPIEGIVYRTPIDILFMIKKCTVKDCPSDTDFFPAETFAVSLPQAGPISILTQNAGFMTDTSYENKFKDGILISYNSSRPSEALALASTPIRIINSAADAAAKVLQVRIGKSNAEIELAKSQLDLLNAQYALNAGPISGQTSVTNAQTALLRAQLGLTAEGTAGATRLTASQLELLNAQLALQARPGAATLSTAQQEYALLQAQLNLSLLQNSATAQQSSSNVNLALTLLRDQARLTNLNKCLAEKVAAGEPVDACLNQP